MLKCKYSEVFFSFNGEGKIPHGVGALFVRFTGCNFTCTGFANPEMAPIQWGFNPAEYTDLNQLPVISKGCDSAYSWHDDFKHLWKEATVDEFVDILIQTLPSSFEGSFVHPRTGQDIILTFTGGEPMLRFKFIIELLKHPKLSSVVRVLIETNGSVTIPDRLIKEYNSSYDTWTILPDLIFSNSPKLSISGEDRKAAIISDAILSQQQLFDSVTYFKFVSDGSVESLEEIDSVIDEYTTNGVHINNDDILIMPVGATLEQQESIEETVAMRTLEHGYIFSPRSHVAVFGNRMGT
jgi:organic radical activating enzyme